MALDSGYDQLQRALKKQQENAAAIANAAGPPALVPAPAVPATPVGVQFNPTATALQQQGALRPAVGNFSAANPQPMTDGAGNLIPQAAAVAAPNVPAGRPGAAPPLPSVVQPPVAAAPTPVVPGQRTPTTPVLATAIAPPPPVIPQATSDSGRALGYGQKINGVNTFSDGSGGPGAPPATVTARDLATIAQGSRLSRADGGVGGNIGSEVISRPGSGVLANTPELGSAEGLALARGGSPIVAPPTIDPYARARADTLTAQANAASDAASIATGDSRSPLGRAARAARIDANSAFGGKEPERAANLTKALDALYGAAGVQVPVAAKIGETGLEQAEATNRNSADVSQRDRAKTLESQTDLAKAVIQRPTPTLQPLADGTAGIVGQDGVVRAAKDAQGNIVRPQIGKPPEDIASFNTNLTKTRDLLIGLDPLTGMVKGADGKPRPPTAAELETGTAAARASLTGNGQNAPAVRPSKDVFLSQARAANPGVSDSALEAYYTKTYGG